MKYTTIYVKLSSPNGSEVTGQIIVKDGYALSSFSDKDLAKLLYEKEKEAGADVFYNPKFNTFIERFKGLKKEAIIRKLKAELAKQGGKITNGNSKSI